MWCARLAFISSGMAGEDASCLFQGKSVATILKDGLSTSDASVWIEGVITSPAATINAFTKLTVDKKLALLQQAAAMDTMALTHKIEGQSDQAKQTLALLVRRSPAARVLQVPPTEWVSVLQQDVRDMASLDKSVSSKGSDDQDPDDQGSDDQGSDDQDFDKSVNGKVNGKGSKLTDGYRADGYHTDTAHCRPVIGVTIGVVGPLDKSFDECKAMCDERPDCAAFEFADKVRQVRWQFGCKLSLQAYGKSDGQSDGKYMARLYKSQLNDAPAFQAEDVPCTTDSCCYTRDAPAGYQSVAARCKPDGKSIGDDAEKKTFDECKAMCDGTPNCAAFEFEFATGECEMSSYVDRSLSLQDEDGPCNSESCCYARPLTAPAGYAQLGRECRTVQGFPLQNQTFDECKKECDLRTHCAAFEFKFATGECEVQLDADTKRSLEHVPCNAESCCYTKPFPAPAGYEQLGFDCEYDSSAPAWNRYQIDDFTFDECKKDHCELHARKRTGINCEAFEFSFRTGRLLPAHAEDAEVDDAEATKE